MNRHLCMGRGADQADNSDPSEHTVFSLSDVDRGELKIG